MDDLSDLREVQEPTYSATHFTKIFNSVDPTEPKRLFVAFKKYLGPTFVIASILLTLSYLLEFAGPLAISKILVFLSSDNPDIWEGLSYATILTVSFFLRLLLLQHSLHYQYWSCIQVSNSCNYLIYSKILRLASSSRKYAETGTIRNYINVDVISFFNFIMSCTILVSGPLMLATAIVLLIMEVGWIGVSAPILFFLGLLIQQRLFKKGS